MTPINIQFTLFSAFYSPLISTMSGGFLREEGLEPSWSVAAPGTSALAALEDGSARMGAAFVAHAAPDARLKTEPDEESRGGPVAQRGLAARAPRSARGADGTERPAGRQREVRQQRALRAT